MNNKSSIIALAWPETKVKKVGVWYDPIMTAVGVNDGTHYKVGHAALLLVNGDTGGVHYFDFGRYHTPIKKGRARDIETDPELKVHTKAKFCAEGEFSNITDVLSEVAKNRATHGAGYMLASVYSGINFSKSFSKAKYFQSKGAVNYGPLDIKGTNCSRFVATVAKAGRTDMLTKLLIMVPYTISPSPKSNIKVINNQNFYYKAFKSGFVQEIEKPILRVKKNLLSIIPSRPILVSEE